jgi:pyridoxine 4-dehydrogenase
MPLFDLQIRDPVMSLAHSSGTFSLGGDLPVHRLGFGAMRITGPGVFGEPQNRDEAISVLRRAVALGIDFIDTADSYGPHVSENLIREALYPYEGLVIATKGGFERPKPGVWIMNGDPGYLRRMVEGSLKRLSLDRLPLWQLHRIDPKVPREAQLRAFSGRERAEPLQSHGPVE